MKCYNHGMLGHFTCECTKPKKVYPNPNFLFSYVCTHVLVAHFLLEWTIDSQATKIVVRNQVRFVDYIKIPTRRQYIK